MSDKDKQRVITALEHLSTGTDLEQYFDVDEILRYFAAHTVVVNLDSYTSNMAQNYYIYERDGKISILPWDYGLTFGGFQSSSASSVVNFPIDTPVSGVSMEDRPLLNVLLAVDEYREMYHDYLNQIVTGYFNSGLFEQTIDRLDAKIGGYVMNDVSAYYTYEQYQSSLPILKELGRLRAESIAGQLDGSIPSTSAGQNADSSSLVDASSINLSVLGSMMGGGGVGGGGVGGGRQRR
ncbi:MAG: CotH kinase family protein [Oscillospiraceae bacterium]|nr:CotH kinase family protein [Oscillospiraceae bacterium]